MNRRDCGIGTLVLAIFTVAGVFAIIKSMEPQEWGVLQVNIFVTVVMFAFTLMAGYKWCFGKFTEAPPSRLVHTRRIIDTKMNEQGINGRVFIDDRRDSDTLVFNDIDKNKLNDTQLGWLQGCEATLNAVGICHYHKDTDFS